jgi:MFS family permease
MKKSLFYGYIIVFICCILQIVSVGPRNSFGVFIKPLTEEFEWNRALISGAFTLSTILLGLSSIFMGWLNDRAGPRIVMTISGILIGAGSILMYFVHSTWQLYLFYSIFIGSGMGGIIAPQMSTVTRWFITRRNVMLGLLMAGGGLGGIIAPPLITWLVYTYNWREAFLFVGAGILIIVVLLAQFLKRDPSKIGQIPYQKGNETRRKALANIDELSLNQALHTSKFWMFSIIIFCTGFCVATISVHVVPLAIDRGISAVNAAVILSVMNVAMTAGNVITGLISEKFGSRRILIVCQCLLLGVVLFLLPVNSAWVLCVFAGVMSLGGGGIAVLCGTIVAELFGLKSNGTIVGVILFVFTLGSLGAFIGGLVFDTTGNYQWVLLICMCLSAAAIIMAFFLNHRRKTEAAGAKG